MNDREQIGRHRQIEEDRFVAEGLRQRREDEERLVAEGVAMLERARILEEFSRRWEGQYDPLNRCQRCGSLAHFEC